MNGAQEPVLAASHLTKTYVTKRTVLGRPRATVRAVNDVSFELYAGRVLGIVGESGSGKSTLARLALQLIPADSGTVLANGVDVTALSGRGLRRWRRNAQFVQQDPFSSMDPRMSVGDSVGEPLLVHEPSLSRADRDDRVVELLESVGVDPRSRHRYPSSFSGGQLQRISIARGLATEPSVLVCDESVSALDVSIRGQILNLLRRLQEQRGIAILFISHDLSLVHAISDDVLVMLRGDVVEHGPSEQVMTAPQHPYTKALLSAVLLPVPPSMRNDPSEGSV